ncbi:MAG: UbiA family prenyltransferase [Syntrophomonadaceae bacterium]|nr:UbiA family prenyltransferase [Syntrophomonadaceae bacterium]
MDLNKLKAFLSLIDIEHTLFGLPFAYLGAFFAAFTVYQGWPSFYSLFWITVAMLGARTAALCLNRVIDMKIDRANPRTAGWILPSGQLSVGLIWVIVFVSFAFLLFAAFKLNPLCLYLSPLAVFILWVYSYTKRFTWLCHLFLGMAIGIGPIGAWFGVTGVFSLLPVLTGAAVAFWVAGFDTMYACQDIEFDRKHGLHSIPSNFGEKGALFFSAVFHLFTIIFLLLNGVILDLGIWYYTGVGMASAILIYQHLIVKPGDLTRVGFASFSINRYVGLIIFITTLIDLI